MKNKLHLAYFYIVGMIYLVILLMKGGEVGAMRMLAGTVCLLLGFWMLVKGISVPSSVEEEDEDNNELDINIHITFGIREEDGEIVPVTIEGYDIELLDEAEEDIEEDVEEEEKEEEKAEKKKERNN